MGAISSSCSADIFRVGGELRHAPSKKEASREAFFELALWGIWAMKALEFNYLKTMLVRERASATDNFL
jgi:hypothetical protein